MHRIYPARACHCVLQFRFNRYRAERNPDFFGPRRSALRKDFTSDLSAVLTVMHPNGQVVREVTASSIEDGWTRGGPICVCARGPSSLKIS